MGKILIIIGLVLIVGGLLMQYSNKIPFLGKLPGDIRIETENVKIYLPITTSILVSILLTIILYVINKFRSWLNNSKPAKSVNIFCQFNIVIFIYSSTLRNIMKLKFVSWKSIACTDVNSVSIDKQFLIQVLKKFKRYWQVEWLAFFFVIVNYEGNTGEISEPEEKLIWTLRKHEPLFQSRIVS